MKMEITDVSPTRKEFKIEIDADEVRAEYDRVSDSYAQLANVPGFRKGHAPRGVVRTRFKNEIRSEVLQSLVPQAVRQAMMESGLKIIGEPDVHLENEGLDKLGEQPVSLHAHVEVLPDVELGQYKGLAASRRTRPVTEETVERMIGDLRESSASLQPVEDRAAELGDTVTVNFRGRFVNEPEEEDINVEDVDVVLGGEGVLQNFTDNLLGVRPDEVRTFLTSYPEDFTSKGLAGKEIEYTATVTAVRRKEVPELDDEWAQSLGEEIGSIEQLRERVRENLTQRAKFESDHRLRDELLGNLVAAHQFEVPESLIEYQSNQLLQTAVRDMMQRGMDPRSEEFNWDAMRDHMRERAGKDLRTSLLLERIADEEKIEVTDEEVEEEISAMAEHSGQTIEQVRAALTKQGGERSIADRLRNRKALELLVENANVRDEEWLEETRAEAGATEADEASDASPTDAQNHSESRTESQSGADERTSEGQGS